ncbi:class III lanthionine synthetase LanKC [Mammaliicoccus sp. FSL K6-3158]|uniref:class III lanthionine synthetase LanKC n=1 Tax=Mammaliicoccus sp. FSL K6-3158 TaxID=2921491 RepID=UPI0030F72734
MKDNTLYNFYLKPGIDFFEKNDKNEDNSYNITLEHPRNFTTIISDESVWKYYHNLESKLPEQGWKIHISCTYRDVDKTLNIVAETCFKRNIGFKHLKDRESYMLMNSKTASRSSSGKFVTIYPTNESEFLDIVYILEDKLSGMEKGPYILSDKRWKKTNIYYRYGGFINITNDLGELCIKTPDGTLIKDERTPYYKVPDFAKKFNQHLESLNTSIEKEKSSKLDEYNIQNALSFSNAGGVYFAKRKSDDLSVIIKEARPQAGLDGKYKDALSRQDSEYNALVQLKEIEGIVNIIDRFKEWEHYFLVEEYIEGSDLKKWISLNFPFYEDEEEILNYENKVEKIIINLINVVDKMSRKNIAMMDMQPANVLIKKNLEIKLIDFETALLADSTDKPGLMTVGFSSTKIKNNSAHDWFGLKKIIKYMVLPIINSEDLDEELEKKHLEWIRKNYSTSFGNFIIETIENCNQKIFELNGSKNNSSLKYKEANALKHKLLKGITKNLTNDQRFIYGDVRQNEMQFGRYNYLNGGVGAGIALSKNDCNNHLVNDWIERYLIEEIKKNNIESGLINGKTSTLSLLYDFGYEDLVFETIKDIYINSLLLKDYSLRSGTSGIGLFLISLYLETSNKAFLDMAIKLGDNIPEDINLIIGTDWAATNTGLIDGYAGISLFYSSLYATTNNQKYLVKSKKLLDNDLKYGLFDLTSRVYQTIDSKGRALPYISGGSIGLGIALWFYNFVSKKEVFKTELSSIANLSTIRSTITGGLFDGAGSFLIIPTLIKEDNAKKEACSKILNLIEMFIIDRNNHYKYAGQFSYRISDDVYSGSAGIIMGILSIENNNPLYWLPLINPNNFMSMLK